jgi:C4-dicarboxylate-specific signal transduction histidine kinase
VDARERLYRLFVAEEVASALRHQLINKISALGALGFHLRRQLPPGTPEAALNVLPMMDAELTQASQTLNLHFIAPAGSAAPVPLAELVEEVLSWVERPAGVSLTGTSEPVAVLGAREELALALRCLVENAVEAVASAGTVTVRCREAEPRGSVPMMAVEVADDGPGCKPSRQALDAFFTTKEGRLGVGLNVAIRIAHRWRGTVELEGARRGMVARLTLPVSR